MSMVLSQSEMDHPSRLRMQAVLLLLMAAGSQGIATTPSCRFRADAADWQTCSQINFSSFCCSGAHQFEIPVSSKLAYDESRRTVNITFYSTVDGTNSFLLSRVAGCSGFSDCYEVVPTYTLNGEIQVEVAFLPGDVAYRATQLDYINFRQWLSHTATNVSAESQFLQTSSITLDLVGPDAHIRLHHPSDNAVTPAAMSSACVTLFSDEHDFPCNRCSCTVGTEGEKKLLCFDQPYNVTGLEAKNATRFYNGTHRLTMHWAVIQIGGSCLKTKRQIILPPPPESPPTPDSKVIDTREFCAILSVIVVLGIVSSCLFRFTRGTKASSTAEPLPQEEPLMNEGTSEVVLLYCWDERNEPFNGVIQMLTDIIGHAGGVEVLDPYLEPMLLETPPVEAAQNILSRPNIYVVFLATQRMFQIGYDDIFDQFFQAASRYLREMPNVIVNGHILTLIVTDDMVLSPPWNERVYFLPDKIEDLLHDIPGAPRGDRFMDIAAQLCRLRRHLQDCKP